MAGFRPVHSAHVTALLLVAVGFLLIVGGCSLLGAEGPDYERQLIRIEAQLRAEVGEARANDVEQCRVLLYGSKPCGGHWHSLVYSTVESDGSRIVALGDEFTRVQREANRASGVISDCMMEPVPTPALFDGRCVKAGFQAPN